MAIHARERRSQDFFDIHHDYWPRRLYRGNIECQFRNLPCHKRKLHRLVHNELHAVQFPPKKPSRAEMLEVLEAHKRQECPKCHQGGDNDGT